MGRPLGQHFLRDKNIIAKIVAAADLSERDRVLEIGPGQGAITGELLAQAGAVTAVELDHKLAEGLRDLPGLRLIEGNILDIDLPLLLGQDERVLPRPVAERSWKVVANLPYYITTPIIEKLLLGNGNYIDYIVVMIQREVAERIAALASRDTGALSYFVNYYAHVEYLFTVKPGCFAPPPKVDSAVIKLTLRRTPPVSAPPKALFQVVRAAFQERRKTLRRSLLKLASAYNVHSWDEVWQQAYIDPQRRPETLTLDEFSALTEAIIANGQTR